MSLLPWRGFYMTRQKRAWRSNKGFKKSRARSLAASR
jgi:hypothetical protein